MENKVVPIGSFPTCCHLFELALVNPKLGICSAKSESDLVVVAQLNIKFRIRSKGSPSGNPGRLLKPKDMRKTSGTALAGFIPMHCRASLETNNLNSLEFWQPLTIWVVLLHVYARCQARCCMMYAAGQALQTYCTAFLKNSINV